MKRVLIIDDEAEFTRLLRMNLEKVGGFAVRVENSSENAMETAREFSPDVILLDIVMPGLDGGDLCVRFQADPKLQKVPVIIVSALVSNDETSQDAVAVSGDQIIVAKPVSMEKMLHSIEEALKKA